MGMSVRIQPSPFMTNDSVQIPNQCSHNLFFSYKSEVFFKKNLLKYNIFGSCLGMAMGQVFSGAHPAPNGTGFNFNKRV